MLQTRGRQVPRCGQRVPTAAAAVNQRCPHRRARCGQGVAGGVLPQLITVVAIVPSPSVLLLLIEAIMNRVQAIPPGVTKSATGRYTMLIAPL